MFHRYQIRAGGSDMAKKTQQRHCAREAYYGLRARAFSGDVHQVKTVEAAESQRLQKIAQAVKAEPVYRRILGMVHKLGVRGHSKPLAVALERRRIPTIERKFEFLLPGAQYVGGTEI